MIKSYVLDLSSQFSLYVYLLEMDRSRKPEASEIWINKIHPTISAPKKRVFLLPGEGPFIGQGNARHE